MGSLPKDNQIIYQEHVVGNSFSKRACPRDAQTHTRAMVTPKQPSLSQITARLCADHRRRPRSGPRACPGRMPRYAPSRDREEVGRMQKPATASRQSDQREAPRRFARLMARAAARRRETDAQEDAEAESPDA